MLYLLNIIRIKFWLPFEILTTLSFLKKSLSCSVLILSYFSFSQTLVINEFSNGPSGVQEYLELIAVDTSQSNNGCNACIDIRGWIIDDNNGYHGSLGIASGCNRFSNDLFWSCIPLGTMITIYNGTETNIDMPADDININDGNCRLVVPLENATLFESNPNTPGAVICDYPNTGWTNGGIWSRIGMRNAGDCIRLVDLNGCEVFSLSYGDITLNSTIYFAGSGIDDVFYFTGNNPYNQADWLQGCAGDPGACPGNDQTPGTPNSNLNDAYISQFTVNDCQPISTSDTSSVNLSICENELPYTWNGLTFSASGIQSVTLSNTFGCDSIVSLNLNVNEVDTSTANLSICENELPYTWNGIVFSVSGSQSVILSSSQGCDSLVTLNLNVNGVDTNTVNLTVCENELPYTWNGITFSASGSQSATLSSSLGCDSLVTLNLTVNQVDTSIVTLTVCENELPYIWNGLTFSASGSQSATLSSSLGCDSVVTLNLNVNEVDTSTVYLTLCENELPYIWNGITFSASGSQSVTLSSSLGCDSLVTLNLNVSGVDTSTVNLTVCENELPYAWNGFIFSSAGTQIINLFNSSGCDSTVNMVLSVTANPAAPSAAGNMQYCINEEPGPIEANGGSGSYTWYADAELLEILSYDSQITPEVYSGNINYYVTTTENGCESAAQIITVQFQACSVVIPSAFTPNGDEINDFWEIKDLDLIYPNSIVQVFNRWGNKIYESQKGNYENMPWNGEINGTPLPVATYYYIIYYNDDSIEPSNGIVSILK